MQLFKLSFLLTFFLALQSWAFSTNNIQYLYGSFDDNTLFDTTDGGKSTITLEHYSTNEYGDLFGFADYEIADERFLYLDNQTNLYFEISPRISFDKLAKSDLSVGFVKEWYAAFQYNRQVAHGYEDFVAYLYGVGCDLDIKGFDVFGLNGYKKNQKFADNTYQLSANYLSTNLFGTAFLLNGFIDWTENDLLTQNQLLYDFGPVGTLGDGSFQAGTEWHYYRIEDTDVRSVTWQFMVKMVW